MAPSTASTQPVDDAQQVDGAPSEQRPDAAPLANPRRVRI